VSATSASQVDPVHPALLTLCYDDGQILVSDRANHRLRWIDNQGNLQKTMVYPECTLPCNAQTSAGTSLGGDYLIVPGLGEDVSGSTFIMDKDNKIVSELVGGSVRGDMDIFWHRAPAGVVLHHAAR